MILQRPQSKQPLPKKAKRIFKGVIFDVYQWRQKMFDGSYETFEKLKRADTVMVLPITNTGKIILTRQKQPGKKIFIGAAGGRVEENEDILTAAKRELLEETGYRAKEYILWDAFQPIGKIEWAVYIFVAKKCQKISAQKLDAGEKIELIKMNFEEFIEQIATGKILNDLELRVKILEAKLDQKKMDALKKIFDYTK